MAPTSSPRSIPATTTVLSPSASRPITPVTVRSGETRVRDTISAITAATPRLAAMPIRFIAKARPKVASCSLVRLAIKPVSTARISAALARRASIIALPDPPDWRARARSRVPGSAIRAISVSATSRIQAAALRSRSSRRACCAGLSAVRRLASSKAAR